MIAKGFQISGRFKVFQNPSPPELLFLDMIWLRICSISEFNDSLENNSVKNHSNEN